MREKRSQKESNFDRYLEETIAAAKSIRLTYVPFLIFCFTVGIYTLQQTELNVFVNKKLILPIVNSEVSLLTFNNCAAVLLLLFQTALLLRIYSLRRLVTVCCYDSKGTLRPLSDRRKVKNLLPSFDFAIAFSPLPVSRIEKVIRGTVAISTIVIFPALILANLLFHNLLREDYKTHLVISFCLFFSLLFSIIFLRFRTTRRRPQTSKYSQKITLGFAVSALFLLLVCVFIFRPASDQRNWNDLEKLYWSAPDIKWIHAVNTEKDDETSKLKHHGSTFYALNGKSSLQREYKDVFNIARSRSYAFSLVRETVVSPIKENFNLGQVAKSDELLRKPILMDFIKSETNIYPTLKSIGEYYPDLTRLSAIGVRFKNPFSKNPLFSSSNFVGTKWDKSILEDPVFDNSKFSLSWFNNVDLLSPVFINSDFRGVTYLNGQWYQPMLGQSTFRGAHFSNFYLVGGKSGALYSSFENTHFEKSVFAGNNFYFENFSQTKFQSSIILLNRFSILDAETRKNINPFPHPNSLEDIYFSDSEELARKNDMLEFKPNTEEDKSLWLYNVTKDSSPIDFTEHSWVATYLSCKSNSNNRPQELDCTSRLKSKMRHSDENMIELVEQYIYLIDQDIVPSKDRKFDELPMHYFTLPNSRIACHLAMFAEELEDLERVILCPFIYGGQNVRQYRKDLDIPDGYPVPFEIDDRFETFQDSMDEEKCKDVEYLETWLKFYPWERKSNDSTNRIACSAVMQSTLTLNL